MRCAAGFQNSLRLIQLLGYNVDRFPNDAVKKLAGRAELCGMATMNRVASKIDARPSEDDPETCGAPLRGARIPSLGSPPISTN